MSVKMNVHFHDHRGVNIYRAHGCSIRSIRFGMTQVLNESPAHRAWRQWTARMVEDEFEATAREDELRELYAIEALADIPEAEEVVQHPQPHDDGHCVMQTNGTISQVRQPCPGFLCSRNDLACCSDQRQLDVKRCHVM